MEQYAALPAQKDSINVWKNTDMAKHLLPPITASDAEAAEMSRIMSEVNTFVSESLTKFTLGVEPVANYSKYLATLKKLNIERAVAIYQKAYNLYQKR